MATGWKKSHCKRGHGLTGDNVYLSPQGIRGCRTCKETWAKEHPQSVEYRSAACARWRKKNPEYHKNHWLMRKYGLTREDYDLMLLKQNNCCAICERLMSRPCVDHNHETDEIRELLCDQCNVAIGLVREDVLIAKRLAEYLEKWNSACPA
jgi:hypothetical protein